MKNQTQVVLASAIALIAVFTFKNKEHRTETSAAPLVSEKLNTPKRTPAQSGSPSATRPSTPPSISSSPDFFSKQLQKYKQCAETEACPYAQTDPKSYEFALHHDVARLISSIGMEDVRRSSELQKELRYWMSHGNGFVQAEILKQFSTLAPSSENLQAILEGVETNYHDPLIMESALKEFGRYGENPQVSDFVQNTLVEGPQLSSLAAAKNIKALLTANNVSSYEALVPKIRSESVREALVTSLRDFRYSLAGG